MLIGVHGSKDLKFTRASVRHHNIDEWANRSPWTTTFGTGSSPFEATITYKDPGDISSPIPGAEVTLTRSIQQLESLSKAEMRSWEWIDFEFETPLDLTAIENGYVRPLGHLLELAANDSCPLLGFNLDPETAKTPHESIKVLSALHRGGELTPKPTFRFNFNLSDIRFEEVMPTWWPLQSELGVTTDLLASVRSTNFVGNTFLNAATAIESYHRHRRTSVSSKKHEPKYAKRIDDVMAEAGSFFIDAVGNAGSWRDWIVGGRNGVAHRDPVMINVDREWLLAVRITTSIQLLMSIVLLRALGVPPEIYEDLIRRAGELQFVTDQLRAIVPGWFV